jgi:uncharacterized RDD family membrane protein YckC
MTKFCPYCGNQFGARSKFCPKCGRSKPERQERAPVGVDVAVDQTGIMAAGAAPAADPAVLPQDITRVPGVERRQVPRTEGRPRTVSMTSRPNGAAPAPARRYVPPTHAMIGVSEQAGFGLRYGAWMFDFLITLIAIMGFTFAVTAASRRSVVGSNTDLLIVVGLTLLLLLLNFVVLAGIGGQTAGMRILGIYIVRVDGKPFTLRQAALRHLIGYPLSMASFFLGFLWMLWDPRQQGWHDKLAHTIVVVSK